MKKSRINFLIEKVDWFVLKFLAMPLVFYLEKSEKHRGYK